MAKFFYTVRNKDGQKTTGIEEASTQEEAISRLQSRNLIVISVVAAGFEAARASRVSSGQGVQLKQGHFHVSGEDLVLFCRQLATLLGAGVTILKSLDIISQQVSSRKLYGVVKDLQKGMETGLSFHEAMARHADIFSELWINLVESGEASGNLSVVLNRLAGYLERNAAFRTKVISALVYPIILLVVSTGALLFMTIKIVPAFADIFKGMNITLPPLTQALIAVSYFLRTYFVPLLVVMGILFFVFKKFLQSKEGRKQFEELQFRSPVFGEFFRSLTVERFSSEMATLLESGVPILYSLEISEHSVGNLAMASIIRQIKEGIREGKPLIEPFSKCGFFDPMVVQMVGIGEEIGELSQMFKKINVFYQEYSETFLNRFVSMFEPFILLFMGSVIGIMIVGMFLPIFQIAKIGGGG